MAAVPLSGLARRSAPRRLTLATATTAVAAHFAALVVYAAVYRQLPFTGLAPTLSSFAFLVGLLALAMLWLTGEGALVLMAAPLVVCPLAIGLLAGFGAPPSAGAPQGGWFLLHVVASLVGIAFLGVAFVAAALYLAQHRELKVRRFGVIFQFVPPLEQLDRLNHLALLAGFPSLTLGIALALAFGAVAGGAPAASAAHLVWGFLAWAVLAAIAAARMLGWLRGRKAALASVGGFAAVSVAFLVLQAVTASGARFL